MAFESPQKKDLFLKHMNGMSDSRIGQYTLIPSPLKSKTDKMLSYADAYYKGAISVYNAYSKISSAPLYVIWEYPFALPILFNCRHSIELTIKALLILEDIDFRKIHSLHELWILLCEANQEDFSLFNKYDCIEMCKFINIMDSIDKKGTTFRYPEEETDINWVNCELLLQKTESFINIIKTKIKSKGVHPL